MTVLDSGQAVRTWDQIPLSELVFTMLDRYSQNAGKAGVTLGLSPTATSALYVRGDRGRLLEALGKIVDNALKFTPGGGQITLHTGIARRNGRDWATLSITDTGPGIPADEQEKVFERFFQGRLAESGHTPGTGLGLSFAWEVLRAHGGQITLESPTGEGLTVTLWLPLAPEG
jgi:signal transduction histidine kinase